MSDPAMLPIYRRGEIVARALVDTADFAAVASWRWSLHSDGYAYRSTRADGAPRTLLLHRVIVGLAHGDPRQVDHANHDGLDCRRENLRIVTHAQNGQNISRAGGTSRFRGVSWHKRRQRWQAKLQVGRQFHFGYFDDELAAAIVVERERRERCPFALPDPELERALAGEAVAA